MALDCSHSIPSVPRALSDVLPLSYAQERLWFLDQLGVTRSAYHAQFLARLEGHLDVGALERSISEVIRRHETLRTRFASVGGAPVQIVDAVSDFALLCRDCSEIRESERQEMLDRVARDELERPFDLTATAPLRTLLIRMSEQEYVLIVTMHHIISDGWSWSVLNRELATLYAAFNRGEASPLAQLTIQYADYAIWQREWLKGDVLERQMRYWRHALRGLPSELTLPTDRKRPAAASFIGAFFHFDLSPRIGRDLQKLAQQQGATVFMVLLAAYAALLSKLSGMEDIVVGCPVAGRSRPETEPLIGFFVNTLVLRVDSLGTHRFDGILSQVRDRLLEALEHQDLSFERLVAELSPDRTLSHQPVFQVAMVMQDRLQDELKSEDLRWTWKEGTRHTALFDVSLHIYVERDGLSGAFEYATDLFDASTIERWARHFTVLLERVVENPSCRVDDLEILQADERALLLRMSTGAESVDEEDLPIHELFVRQVAQSPLRLAVVSENEALTYEQLNRRSQRLADLLRQKGVGPDTIVALCIGRGVDMMVSILGVLKAGAAYLPLDLDYPQDRLQYMLEASGACAVVVRTSERLRLPKNIELVVEIDSVGHAETTSTDGLPSHGRSKQLAYMLFTSGSTGRPKGVMIEHRNVVRFARSLEAIYSEVGYCQNVALNASLSFDASVQQVVQLLAGRTIFIVPGDKRRDPRRLLNYIAENKIHSIDCTPSQLKSWVYAGLVTHDCDLRLVLVGGEALEEDLWTVLSGCAQIAFYNVYGPTECTVDVTSARVGVGTGQPTIGRPMLGNRVYILDRRLEPVPVGVVGEIFVGGDGVGRGYGRSPALTAERYIPDSLSARPGSRLYRTGDRARWRPWGDIEYIGRSDNQVKIRGHRIETGEIEARLLQLSEVKDAAVVARADTAGEARLIAYVVLATGRGPGESQKLREGLRDTLPDYMIPSVIVVLDCFPLSPSGKVDRRALPEPDLDLGGANGFTPPSTDAERGLSTIWQELLGVSRVSREDSFFELGGHSLLALKAIYKISQRYNVELSVGDFYRSPRLCDLASAMGGARPTEHWVDLDNESKIELNAKGVSIQTTRIAEAILLTGGTGFVGRHILVELLERTAGKIFCLVRSSTSDARAAVKNTLMSWSLWRPEYDSRVRAVPGDLRKPRLGMTDECYEAVCRHVGTIYHCATSMNHLETYEMAKRANVMSSHELLKIAVTGSLKTINYISTTSVFNGPSNRVVDEHTPIDHERHRDTAGYVASKWVSEKIFMKASAAGIPCNIHRLGLVWADSTDGRYDDKQREYRVFKSALLSGFGIKGYSFSASPTPVDYVARSVVLLGRLYSKGGGVFHLSAGAHSIQHPFELSNEIATTDLELVTHFQWIQVMKELHRRGRTLPIVPLIEHLFSMSEAEFDEHQVRSFSASASIDCERTNTILAACGIAAPHVTPQQLLLFIDALRRADRDFSEEKGCVPRRGTGL